ncbi:GMC family oxidoreductase N-terminal domain-containing protein [Mangrovicoccus ximenensis]|uniref:GMC family oxidoreductase N-terminal domain-containing protein n=1 Tax=Mangrovicoccus ximenensis TaxID=1911570 RepID=UPI000D33E240|nr:GMC family oxidoreductase N-terminal domain-containing protein [Mangrovicoccus ximenensis]
MTARGRVQAVLGPTNTGKTHYAIERMLSYRTGVIGLPLRLLAREVYDRIVEKRGPSVVALVTGEERIVPERTQYWVCTVEAMPEGLGADFVAIDEIQLCADPERGHVFTDRLLRSRGFQETLFLGASTMRGAIAALVPEATFQSRERFSELSHTGSKKISRMPPRSAIVGFSVDSVYSIAEVIRRLKGGAAVVMGALSPRTRNAQVEMYQNGDVDYLVATDAIGMGLNLDIRHVAFSSTHKFDGRRMRPLQPNELAQIAGRAGRHTEDGTFGVTGEARPLHEDLAEAIVENRFAPVTKLQWRNSRLNFANLGGLIASLEEHTHHELLTRARDADDVLALKSLASSAEVRNRANNTKSIRLLWDVCRIPDFRGISETEHAALLERIYEFLHDRGRITDDWMAAQVRRIDRTEGDIDALSKRLAYIRTWTYVAQRQGWLDDESHWREVTRSVEDRLSDALHARLTQRFVDRRTSVLLRRLKEKESLVAEVNDKGEVTVEGQFVGRLEGFRFSQDKAATADEAKTLRQAAVAALAPEFHLRADRFYNAPDTELDFTDQGGLMWGEHAVGKLVAGAETLKPQVKAFVDDEAGPDVAQKVQRRLQHFIDRKVNAAFEPLLAMSRDEALSPQAKGFAFRMMEGQGIIPRDAIANEVKALDQETRGQLRKHGVRFGQFTIFMPLLLKPAPTRLRLVLWALEGNLDEFPSAPPPGLVTVPTDEHAPEGYHAMAGYRPAGVRAIRIDMLERLADLLSEDPAARVLLVEAGPEPRDFWLRAPAGMGMMFMNARYNWRFETAPVPGLGGRRVYWPRGKTLGGSSAINGMVYMRGHPMDYDHWAGLGNEGWGWDDVLPYFLKSEDNVRIESGLHAKGGAMRVSDPVMRHPATEDFVAAAEAAGIPRIAELNAPPFEGVSYQQFTIRGGRRESSYTAFLKPVRNRPNLAVETGTRVLRVLTAEGRATGIETAKGGRIRTRRARREVILCGWGIHRISSTTGGFWMHGRPTLQ